MSSVDATSSRARVHDAERPHPEAKRATPPLPRPSVLGDHHAIDQAVRDACRNAAYGARPANDSILYVGMRDTSAPAELAALGSDVTRTVSAQRGSTVTLDDHGFDLANPAEIRKFADALGDKYGLRTTQRNALFLALENVGHEGRDELARIALVWAAAEQGAAIPSRLVVSGHSSAGSVWGNDMLAGVLPLKGIRALAAIFPQAARQIEDVHFAGCETEFEVQHADDWTAAFPNLKTLWGYAGTAPEAAANDLAAWRAATNGRADHFDPSMVHAHAPATVWSKRDGVAEDTVSAKERAAAAIAAERNFDGYVSGEHRISDPHGGNAMRDYRAYEWLAARGDEAAATRGAQLLRLRYWETSVRGDIANHYGAEIEKAFSDAGLPPIDVATMTRKQTMDAIAALRAKIGSLPPILAQIATLDSKKIPASWCH